LIEFPKTHDIRIIRRWGDEEGGKALCKYLRAVAEIATLSFVASPATDVEAIARVQGGVKVAHQIIELLTGDPKRLVDQYAYIEEEGEEDA
jgi:hypothetical protein